MANAETWEKAREMRTNGASLSETARAIGVTRQGVSKRERKEGWLNQNGEPGSTVGMNPKQAVVANLRRGCPIKVAAGAVGVHPNTVGNWRKQDPEFDAECRAAISLYGVDRISDLTRASERGDTRATKLALETHEATREDFAPRQSREGLTLVLFSRDSQGPAEIAWPQRPAIEGAFTEINSTDGEK